MLHLLLASCHTDHSSIMLFKDDDDVPKTYQDTAI